MERFPAGSYRYQPFYCEENVWWLLEDHLREHAFALFVSGAGGTCVLWHQKAAPNEQPILWDYHVVALQNPPNAPALVWDLDTTLPCPVDAKAYFEQTFGHLVGPQQPRYHERLDALFPQEAAGALQQMQPGFALIPREQFLAELYSDRLHMKDARGHWMQPPPPWEPITAGSVTLQQHIDAARAPDATALAKLYELVAG